MKQPASPPDVPDLAEGYDQHHGDDDIDQGRQRSWPTLYVLREQMTDRDLAKRDVR